MSPRTLDKNSTRPATTDNGSAVDRTSAPTTEARRNDIAGLLARMTPDERRRAYQSGVFSRRELFTAAAREPDRMPLCNGEFEWIALSLADLD